MMENMKLFSTFRLTILKALRFMLLLSADFFFKINFFKHYFSNSIRVQTIWIQIRTDRMFAKIISIYGPQRKKTCLRGLANNKGAD